MIKCNCCHREFYLDKMQQSVVCPECRECPRDRIKQGSEYKIVYYCRMA